MELGDKIPGVVEPPPHVAWNLEFWGFAAALILAFLYAIRVIIDINAPLVLALAAGLAGLAVVLLGGTRICLPLYLATAFGDAIPLPGLPGASINQCLALAVLAAFVVDVLKCKVILPFRAAQNLLLVFAIYLVAVTMAIKPPETEYPVQAAFYMSLAVIIATLFWDVRWLNFLIGGIVIVGVLVLVLPGYVEYFTGLDYRMDGRIFPVVRIDGFAKDSVIFGGVCVWLLFFAFYLCVSSKDALVRWFSGLSIPLIVVVSLLTSNRQTPIVIVICMATMLFFLRSRFKYLFGGLILIAGLAASPFFVTRLFHRFETAAGSYLNDASLIERHDKLEMAKNMFSQHWLLGVGHGAFKDLWSEYIPPGKLVFLLDYPRNRSVNVDMGYMQILVEYGLVGTGILFLFLIAMLLLFHRCYRMSRQLDNPVYTNLLAMCAALFMQLLVSLFIRDAFVTPQTYVVFGIFFAVCTATEHAARLQAATGAADGSCPA